MDKNKFSNHALINQVTITDEFWRQKQELVINEVLPYQYRALLDEVEGAEKSYCIENFIKAGKIRKQLEAGEKVKTYPADKWCYDDNNAEDGAFHGWVFQDSDVYKWLEAVGYVMALRPDDELWKKADGFIDIICDAQLSDGYLDTLYIINDISRRFTNLKDFHELYCFGHLAEAAVSIYNSTGDRRLLNAACSFADLIYKTFVKGRIKGYPGHEIAELALVKLYDVTGNDSYLELAKFFIDNRGSKPFYYDRETGRETDGTPYIYNQAHIEPYKQRDAVGHAVRGVYLYSGMADVCRRFEDDSLYTACREIWKDITERKMYVTGGIGSTVDGEAFTYAYDLPNDLAYCESCASVGLIFFARRMSELEENPVYGEVAERALYNTVLAGMAEDGKSFFYVNPLEADPIASALDSRKRHIKTVRQKWFSCACCPPNIARLIASLGEYIYNENKDTIFVNQLISSNLKSDKADISLRCGEESFTLDIRAYKPFTLKVRNGGEYEEFFISSDTKLEFKKDNKIRLIKCSNRVKENTGKVCVMKGSTVYCLEEVDNGKDLQMLLISSKPEFSEKDGYILAKGYREKPDGSLYSEYKKNDAEAVTLKFIPYFRWANRGENEMTVYLRIKDETVQQ